MTPQELQDQITKLQSRLAELEGNFYKNNFTSSQIFNKDVVFNSRLRVPVFDAAPTVAEIGDLICVAAELYICTDNSPVTFTVVGTQT